jgi:SHS2 domain-containing protein
MKNYRIFDHTADIGCEVSGRSREELLVNAVMAMLDILIDQPSGHRKNNAATEAAKWQERIVTISGSGWEDLLINFLRESLYLFNGEGWIIRHCAIAQYNSKRMIVRMQGEPYSRKQHSIKAEIKAVTYSGLSIKKLKSGWRAKVIFDV